MTILLIDYDEAGLKVRKHLLTRTGYDTLAATTGTEGIHLAQTLKVDLVLLDYHLPDMTGDELIKRLREIKPDTHMILLSGQLVIPESKLELVDEHLIKGSGALAMLKAVEAGTA